MKIGHYPCEHGVRWPHHCDDCDRRDFPGDRSIFDHPCHGLSASQKPGELSHRAYIDSGPIYCERCGTELDRNKRQKSGAPLSWEPRAKAKTVGAIDDMTDAELLARAVRGARGRTGRSNPRWVGIADIFSLGRTYSRQLAHRFGLDPDEMVRR